MKESKTFCLKSHNKHYNWNNIGVIVAPNGAIKQVLKCSYCKKVWLKKLEEIVRVYQ